MSKLILDLCGGTGSWSAPYKENNYRVINVTLPEYNVTNWGDYHDIKIPVINNEVYGILAAPPCTMFSHARTVAKEPRDTEGAMKVVKSCLEIIWESQYTVETGRKVTPLKFWALENPAHGILKNFIGEPVFTFDPYEFGDSYKKRTALWGNFKVPKKEYNYPLEVMTEEQLKKHKTNSQKLPKFDRLKTKEIHQEYYGKLTRKERRAITPRGFAEAFFKANR